jgi:hypothetical protein
MFSVLISKVATGVFFLLNLSAIMIEFSATDLHSTYNEILPL